MYQNEDMFHIIDSIKVLFRKDSTKLERAD